MVCSGRYAACAGLALGLGLISVASAQTAPPPEAPEQATAPGLAQSKPAAPPELARVTFSKLLFRVEKADEIGVAKHDYRVFILEDMRSLGFNAVGAENLVFERDDSDTAEYVLGGTIREIDCREVNGTAASCYLGVEWELLHAQQDEVVYKALIRHAEHGLEEKKSPGTIGKRLVLGALRRLLQRPRLAAILRSAAPPAQPQKPDYPAAILHACARGPIALPADAEQAIAATVMIEAKGIGSGFVVSPEGHLLTAAHVVSNVLPTVTMSDGTRYRAEVVRIARSHDVALLRIATTQPAACLPPALDATKPGAEIYAIGAPAGKKLAFSLTRGIVSGLRDFDGVGFVQTDASVSPGNSGGPLVDNQGRAVGVVSWKVAGSAIEGVAFAVPTATALDALGLLPGDHTDAALMSGLAELPDARRHDVQADVTDPIPSLDPEADRMRAEQAKEAQHDRRVAAITPGYVPVLRWGGAVVAAAGLTAIIASAAGYDSGGVVTRDEYQDARLMNDLGWVALSVGASAAILSLVLQPTLPEEAPPAGKAHARIEVDAGLGSVRIAGTY